MNLLPVFSSRVYVPHVEADQDLGRLKKKNGLLGSNTILLRVNTFNDVFLREIELHMGFIEKITSPKLSSNTLGVPSDLAGQFGQIG